MTSLPLVRTWVWISAAATVAGWSLSLAGELNRRGYLVFTLLAAVLWFWVNPRTSHSARMAEKGLRHATLCQVGRLRRRFRHWLPGGFLLLAILIFAGAVIYPPTNHAALTYRIPRVLQWLSEEHWFWIHTPNYRMNDRACGVEWLSAPLILFSRSDRLLFLTNFLPFLLMPGLVFSLLTRLGVGPRIAWQWMWIIPTGYSFLLQAGSVANDTFPTVYALAAVDFALRARTSGRISDVGYSVVSAALLTGAKASNLPLLLPWGVLLVGLFPLVRKHWLAMIPIGVVAATVSFLPTAVLNHVYCGDWTGLSLERTGMSMRNPWVGLWGNLALLALNNLVPPLFPQAGWWNQNVLGILPEGVRQPLVENFESGFHVLWELPTEDWVGLGFGVTVLALLAVFSSLGLRRKGPDLVRGGWDSYSPAKLPQWLRLAVLLTPWVALLFYCTRSGMVTGARLISPYYPLLLAGPIALTPQRLVIRNALWKKALALALLLAIPVVVLTPSRPLWPARTILSQFERSFPGNRTVERAARAYAVYGQRSDPLSEVRARLPADLRVVGFLADGDDMDYSLWRPLLGRKVLHVLLSDSGDQIRSRGIKQVVVGGAFLKAQQTTIEDWVQKVGGRVDTQVEAILKVHEGLQPWYVVSLGS